MLLPATDRDPTMCNCHQAKCKWLCKRCCAKPKDNSKKPCPCPCICGFAEARNTISHRLEHERDAAHLRKLEENTPSSKRRRKNKLELHHDSSLLSVKKARGNNHANKSSNTNDSTDTDHNSQTSESSDTESSITAPDATISKAASSPNPTTDARSLQFNPFKSPAKGHFVFQESTNEAGKVRLAYSATTTNRNKFSIQFGRFSIPNSVTDGTPLVVPSSKQPKQYTCRSLILTRLTNQPSQDPKATFISAKTTGSGTMGWRNKDHIKWADDNVPDTPLPELHAKNNYLFETISTIRYKDNGEFQTIPKPLDRTTTVDTSQHHTTSTIPAPQTPPTQPDNDKT